MKKGNVIGIISIKGGVGKTTTVSNLGAILANKFNKKVLIIDANFSSPNLHFHFGIKKPEYSIQDLLLNKANLEQTLIKIDERLHILPGIIGKYDVKRIKPALLKNRLKEWKKNYDIVLLDSSPNITDEILTTIVASEELFAITTPDVPTLSCTMHAVKVAKENSTPILGIIINKMWNDKYQLDLDSIEEACQSPVLACIPYDNHILISLAKSLPIVIGGEETRRESSIEYKKLAAALIGETYQDRRIKTFVKRLFGSLSKQDINRDIFYQKRKNNN